MTSPTPVDRSAPAPAPTCPCGRATVAWRLRDTAFSPGSFVGGVVVVAIAMALGWWSGAREHVLLVPLLTLPLVLAALVVQAVRGHRGSCLFARSGWFGIAVLGLPFRILWSINV